jgi:serine/threonine protein kinase
LIANISLMKEGTAALIEGSSSNHAATIGLVPPQKVERVKVSVSDFQFIKVLGTGGFSTVYLVKHRQTHELFAMKSIRIPGGKLDKDKSTLLQQIRYEKQILMALKHPFIVKLKYAFCAKRRFFLVMALVQGGEFLSYIRTCEKRKIEEV